MNKSLLIFFFALALSISRPLFGGAILSIYEAPHTALDLELDPYYSTIDFFIYPFASSNKKTPVEQKKVFGELLKTSFLPRVIAFELSVNPLPVLAGILGTAAPTAYSAITPPAPSPLNWIKWLTAKYEEPYAASIFLGNVVRYQGEKPLFTDAASGKPDGRIQSGLLVSFSPHHLFNNIFVPGVWFETELRFRDRQRTKNKSAEWDFRLGARFSLEPQIEHTVFASAAFERRDFFSPKFLLVENTRLSFRFDKGLGSATGANNFWRFGLTVEKSFPLKNSKFAFTFPLGIVVNINSPYAAGAAWGAQDPFGILFMPGFKF